MSNLGRRAVFVGAGAAWLGCRSRPAPPTDEPPLVSPPLAPVAPADAGQHVAGYERAELALPGTISPRVVVLTPRVRSVQFPCVVALPGRGEARKGPTRGPLGWPEDYALERALERIAHPPLTREDFLGFVRDEDLAAQNAALAAQPYRGLIILCPYLPDLELEDSAAQDAYGRFLIDALLPRARATFPILPEREHTGIDGISLGGAVALHVGTQFPESFGAVSGMQPAIQRQDAAAWAARFVAAKRGAGSLAVRLQTSTEDPFRGPTEALSAELRQRGLEHTFTETPGPHDYAYNRGPAAYALLSWHDRALR